VRREESGGFVGQQEPIDGSSRVALYRAHEIGQGLRVCRTKIVQVGWIAGVGFGKIACRMDGHHYQFAAIGLESALQIRERLGPFGAIRAAHARYFFHQNATFPDFQIGDFDGLFFASSEGKKRERRYPEKSFFHCKKLIFN
jgi:hypothetical protein